MDGLSHTLGFDEKRCLGCLTPFVPPKKDARTTADMVDKALCPLCRDKFTLGTLNTCRICGMPVYSDFSRPLCGSCMREPPLWASLCFIGYYEGLLSDLVQRLKFGADFAAGNFLGGLLAELLAGHGTEYDLLIPMPVHPSRLLQRGHNQCRELARPIASRLGLKVEGNLLRRKRATVPQAGLSAEQRLVNVKDAFHCSPIKSCRVLLLDDILTTGATVRHAVKAMLRAGADSVGVAVAARTPLN